MPPHLSVWPGDDLDRHVDAVFERVRWLLANGYDDPDEWGDVLEKSHRANRQTFCMYSDLERFRIEAPTVGLLLRMRR